MKALSACHPNQGGRLYAFGMTEWQIDSKSETPIRFLSAGDLLYNAAIGTREVANCYSETYDNGEFTGLFVVVFVNGDKQFYRRNTGISEV